MKRNSSYWSKIGSKCEVKITVHIYKQWIQRYKTKRCKIFYVTICRSRLDGKCTIIWYLHILTQ